MRGEAQSWSRSRSQTYFDMWVPAEPSEVRRVRRALGDLDLPSELLDEARLLLTEVLTNSVRHAGLSPQDRIRVRAEWSDGRLRIDVWDRPQATAPGKVIGAIRPLPGSESGWGLFLVDSLASRWGATAGRHWFELDAGNGSERAGNGADRARNRSEGALNGADRARQDA